MQSEPRAFVIVLGLLSVRRLSSLIRQRALGTRSREIQEQTEEAGKHGAEGHQSHLKLLGEGCYHR